MKEVIIWGLLSLLFCILCFFLPLLVDMLQDGTIEEEWQRYVFNKKFNWILKHKDKLPLSQEYKEIFIKQNQRYIAIPQAYYKELRKYWRKRKWEKLKKLFSFNFNKQ